MSTPNVERLEAVLAQIKDHPETWKQSIWAQQTACGTAYCFAGHAVQMYGLDEYRWALVDAPWAKPGELELQKRQTGARVPVSRVAVEILGMKHAEAEVMFMAGNSLEQLELVVKGLANGEDITALEWRVQNLGW